MTTKILLAGFGGQGILFAGKFLAYAGLVEGREVTWMPSYGPEMRGGLSNCSVIISDAPISSPLVPVPDALVVLNLPSFTRFEPDVKAGGLLLVDSSLIDLTSAREDLRAYYIPSTRLADDEDLSGLANMIMLGKLLKETALVRPETLRRAMEKVVPARKADLLEKNLRALALGQGI